MKLGIVLQSNNPERVWNALRLAITARKAKHEVQIFLLSEGVELEKIPDSEHFDISKKVKDFSDIGGTILACGSCLKSRSQPESAACPVSTMAGLLRLVEESDKVLTFD
ncbi:MAG: DsrE family protein [Patescibacteria group bacterium]